MPFFYIVLRLSLSKTDILFDTIFSKRSSHLTISFHQNWLRKKKEIFTWQTHKILYWKYMSSISRFFNYLYCWIYSASYISHKKLNQILQEPDWSSVSIWNLKSLLFVFIRFITRCHLLSLIVIFCHSLSFAITLGHSFSFVATRCHSFYHSLSLVAPFVVTRCTAHLSL